MPAVSEPAPVSGFPPGFARIDDANHIPPGLQLVQAHVFARHGERTPVRRRLVDQIEPNWSLCAIGRQFKAAIYTHAGPSEINVQRIAEAGGRTGDDAQCGFGELTDIGRASTYRLGEELRKLYVDRLGFLAGNIDEIVTFRSTPMPRTIESATQIAAGLLGPDHARRVRLTVRDAHDESLYPVRRSIHPNETDLTENTGACARLRELDIRFGKQAAKELNHTLEALDDRLVPIVGVPVRIDSSPRANGVLDTVNSAIAHGIKVPAVFDDPTVTEPLERAVVAEWSVEQDSALLTRAGSADISTAANSHDWPWVRCSTISSIRSTRQGEGV